MLSYLHLRNLPIDNLSLDFFPGLNANGRPSRKTILLDALGLLYELAEQLRTGLHCFC